MVEFSEVYKEAVASVPNAQIIYTTLEIRHPSFIDEQGNNISVFLISDYDDLKATLEPEHPLNPSQEVTFKAFAFDAPLPELSPGVVPQAQVKVDNVSTEISQYLEQAVDSEEPKAEQKEAPKPAAKKTPAQKVAPKKAEPKAAAKAKTEPKKAS